MKKRITFCLFCFVILCTNGCAANMENSRLIDEPFKTTEIIDTTKEDITEESIMKDENMLPDVFPMEFVFSSGAGAWRTYLTLNRDGSFTGEHTDSEMGEYGDDYPEGTVYICEFNGSFDQIRQIDEYSYSMKIKEVITSDKKNKEWIEGGVRYVYSEPYGLEDGENFIFYNPETPTDSLSEDFLVWWPSWYFSETDPPKTLSCYGLYNQRMGYGFFSYE